MPTEYSPARRFPRFAVDLLAIRANAPPRLDRVVNLSRGGALLDTRAALPVGTVHTFLFIMPGRESRSVVAAVEAVVAWAGATQLGLQFRVVHEVVEQYLSRLAG